MAVIRSKMQIDQRKTLIFAVGNLILKP